MVTKENINKLTSTLSEITKTLHAAIALTNDAIDATGKLQESISALSREKEKPSGTTSAIVDQFKAHTSINDTVHKSGPAIAMRHPIRDIAKAIAISDRFLFIKELFDNNTTLFAQTVNELNMMSNLEDAKKHIQTVVKNWDDTSEPAQLFLSIVQRRYL